MLIHRSKVTFQYVVQKLDSVGTGPCAKSLEFFKGPAEMLCTVLADVLKSKAGQDNGHVKTSVYKK